MTVRKRGLATIALVGVVAFAILRGAAGGSDAPAVTAPGKGRSFYAAPNGTPNGTGTAHNPLDLATALSSKGPVLPGDTLWLRGGTYSGVFSSELRGTEQAPITVRSAPGERARIDSGASGIGQPTFNVKGAWTTYADFEVMSSEPTRVLNEGGSQPAGLKRGMGVDGHGPHLKFVNLIVHDLADGIGLWSDGEESEAYGNIIYYNGWSAQDRSHGHGIYTQNERGVRRITDNIIFDQFSHGIHAYGSSAATLDRIQLVGNVVFNNGALDAKYYDRNILLGGHRPALDPVLEDNFTYYTAHVRHGGENNVGYAAGCTNLIAKNNYFAGQIQGGNPFVLSKQCAGEVSKNRFIGPIEPWIGEQYPDNEYEMEGRGVQVFVRRNKYAPGRAHVIVYNWDRLPTLTMDLSSARLASTGRYELRDVQNLEAAPVASGTFGDGKIEVSLRSLKPASPVGIAAPVHTAPEFAVFVLTGQPLGDSSSGGVVDWIVGLWHRTLSAFSLDRA